MRFTTVLLSGLVAVATAQTTTTTTPTTLSTATSTTSESVAETSQSEIVKCIDACPAGDVGCTAKCIAVPNPDPAAVNATNTCVAACPQGNGTATDNLNYQNCVDACIGKYYFTATTAGAPQTTSSGAGVVVTTTDRNGATVTSTSTGSAGTQGSASGSGSPAGSSAAPSGTTGKNGGGVVRVRGVVGLVGVVAGLLAI